MVAEQRILVCEAIDSEMEGGEWKTPCALALVSLALLGEASSPMGQGRRGGNMVLGT